MKQQTALDVKAFHPGEGFVKRYQKLVKDVVIPYQYKVLSDMAGDDTEKSHVIANFINAGKALRGESTGDGFYGMVFQDSDAGKWLEAVAYILTVYPDSELEATADELIEIIASAQDEDGYLDTYFTIKDREKRWTNLLEAHELYCAGHLMEAAAAYYEATGKDRFLKVMEKNAEHIYRHFIVEGAEGYPGHPEVELALLRMYDATGNSHCLELAEHFLNVRGVDPAYYEKEKSKRSWIVWGSNPEDHYYNQNYAPVRDQKDAVGHSVRAVYLYTAMADLAGRSGDESLKRACQTLWDSITKRRMYVTGGIGSTANGEAFTVDYDLPNDTVYAETCASVGLMFFARRMLELSPDRKYADVMELAFYNTVLAGMQLDGTRFFYVNPLEVIPGISHATNKHWHVCTTRPKWYTCACCPPNVARLLAGFGTYAYGTGKDGRIFCHLYAAGTVNTGEGTVLACETDYPYGFTVRYRVEEAKAPVSLAIRIPTWSRTNCVTVNGTKIFRQGCQQVAAENRAEEQRGEKNFRLHAGYLYLDGLEKGSVIELQLDEAPFYCYASAKIPFDTDKVCIRRGPLVYCFEGVDHGGDVLSLLVDDTAQIQVEEFQKDLLGGIVPLTLSGWRMEYEPDAAKEDTEENDLYTRNTPKKVPVTLHAVPYYTWSNRGENQMRVWMNR